MSCDTQPAGEKPTPLLIDSEQLCALLGIGRSALFDLLKDKLIPAPVSLPGWHRHRWRLREIEDWVNEEMPPARDWTWRPTRRVKLEVYIDSLKAEAAELGEEIRKAQAALTAGKTVANVR